MLDLALEGVDSLRLPCSWVILFPAAALTVYARRRNAATIAAFVVAAIVTSWLRFSGWWFGAPAGGVQIAVGLVLPVRGSR